MYGSKCLVMILVLSFGTGAVAQVSGQNTTIVQECKTAAFKGTVDALQIDFPALGAVYFLTGGIASKAGFSTFLAAPVTAAAGYSIRKAARALGPNSTNAAMARGAVGGSVKYFHKYAAARIFKSANVKFPVLYLVEGAVNNVCYELTGPYLEKYCSSSNSADQARCAGILMAIEGSESLVEGALMGYGAAMASVATAAAAGKTFGAGLIAKTIIGSALTGAAGGLAVGFVIYVLVTNPNVEKMATAATTSMTESLYAAGSYLKPSFDAAGSYLSDSLVSARGYLPTFGVTSGSDFTNCRRDVPGTTKSSTFEDGKSEDDCFPEVNPLQQTNFSQENAGSKVAEPATASTDDDELDEL